MNDNNQSRHSTSKGIKKKIIIGIVVFIMIAGGIGAILESQEPASSNKNEVVEKVQAENTPTPKGIEKVDIQVESQIVKKIDKKYRYFFSINNQDDHSFNGKLHIVAKTGSGTKVISKYVDFAEKPLEAGLSRVIHADANSAPEHIAGEYGASVFTFSATLDNDEVANGEGIITEEFEDLQ